MEKQQYEFLVEIEVGMERISEHRQIGENYWDALQKIVSRMKDPANLTGATLITVTPLYQLN